jgi:hypothetical protein
MRKIWLIYWLSVLERDLPGHLGSFANGAFEAYLEPFSNALLMEVVFANQIN